MCCCKCEQEWVIEYLDDPRAARHHSAPRGQSRRPCVGVPGKSASRACREIGSMAIYRDRAPSPGSGDEESQGGCSTPELPCVCRDELLCRAGRSVTSITSSSSRGDRARRVYFSPTKSNGPCASTQGQGSALLQARGETHRSGVGRHPIQSPYSVIVPYSCRLGASSSRCTSRARVRIETGKLYTTLASRSVTWNLNNSSRRQRVRRARILDAALLWESNLLRAYLRRILGGRHEV